MIIRRAFLKGSLVALAAPDLLFGATSVPTPSTSSFALAWFEARRGTSFRVKSGGSWRKFELVDVQPLDLTPELEQFHVVMRGAAGVGVPEGLHVVQPEGGDSAALYLRPNGLGDLTATFCRLREKGISSGSGHHGSSKTDLP